MELGKIGDTVLLTKMTAERFTIDGKFVGFGYSGKCLNDTIELFPVKIADFSHGSLIGDNGQEYVMAPAPGYTEFYIILPKENFEEGYFNHFSNNIVGGEPEKCEPEMSPLRRRISIDILKEIVEAKAKRIGAAWPTIHEEIGDDINKDVKE